MKVKMNKAAYLGLSIFEISKTLKYKFWYGYIKVKNQQNAKLYYMDANILFVNIKTEDLYEDIAIDVEKRFDTLNQI